MVLPFFVLFLAAVPGARYAEEGVTGVLWRALVLSTVLGLLVGGLGGRLLQWSRARGWVTWEWRQVYPPAVAAASYGLAVVTDGSGFIAAWVAGFAFGFALRRHRAGAEREDPDRTAEFAENLGRLLASISLLIFGAVLLGPALEHLSGRIVVYAVLSLTVVRMLPVALSLLGSGLRPFTVVYVGWFGPRGLASVVLALLVVEEHVPGVELLGRVVAITVGLSVLLHGVSAAPLAERYGRWHQRAAAGTRDLREGAPVPERPASRGQ
jgi:NhaP-type Na+/H+ or K+/H+ antiporter